MPKTAIKLKPEFLLEKVAERKINKVLSKINRSGVPFHLFYHADFQPSYFTPYMQTAHTITSRDGRFQNEGGLLEGQYIYVTTKDNRIIAKRWDSQTIMNHSFLSRGKSVKAAGFMEFEKGVLKTIDYNSGHYKPSVLQMLEFLESLTQMVKDPVIFKNYGNKGVIESCLLEELVLSAGNMEGVQKTKEINTIKKEANKRGLFNRYLDVLKRKEILERELEFQINLKSRAQPSKPNRKLPLELSVNDSGYIMTTEEVDTSYGFR